MQIAPVHKGKDTLGKKSSKRADSQQEGKAAKQGSREAARTAGQQIKVSQPDLTAEKEYKS